MGQAFELDGAPFGVWFFEERGFLRDAGLSPQGTRGVPINRGKARALHSDCAQRARRRGVFAAGIKVRRAVLMTEKQNRPPRSAATTKSGALALLASLAEARPLQRMAR